MEVEGRRGSDMDEGENTITCEPCGSEGQFPEADGFCKNCQEFMCSDCLKFHKKAKLTKHHATLGKTSMPTKKPENGTLRQMCTEMCGKHSIETIKFYCAEHDMVGCSDCMIMDHNQCKKRYITEVALSFIEGEDFKNLMRRIRGLKNRAISARIKITEEENESENLIEESAREVREFRNEINSYLDKTENALLVECTEIQKNNKKIAAEVTEKLDLVKKEIDGTELEIESKKDRPADLFATAKRIETRLKTAECAVEQLSKSVEIKRKRFSEGSVWRKLINGNVGIGEIRDVVNVFREQPKQKDMDNGWKFQR